MPHILLVVVSASIHGYWEVLGAHLTPNILIPHQVNTLAMDPTMDPTTIDAPPSLIRDLTVAAASPPASPIAAPAPP